MILDNKQIITFLQLSQLGRAKVFALCNYARNMTSLPTSDKDLLDFLVEAGNKNNLLRNMDMYSISNIQSAKDKAQEIIENSAKNGIEIISYYDNLFPAQLRNFTNSGKDASPLILYYKGDISKIYGSKGVAIIGTREPTEEGITTGTYLGSYFAKQGFNIISGLAKGCDTCAHIGALDANGMTTAFLAHGLDKVYPKENTDLAKRILDNGGLLMSEYHVGTSVRPNFLVERDRLQSGLADATIIIQTGLKGGTMHATRTTVENSKPLYAVKYKDGLLNNSEKIEGNMRLIYRNDAKPLINSELESIVESINQSIKYRRNYRNNLI